MYNTVKPIVFLQETIAFFQLLLDNNFVKSPMQAQQPTDNPKS